MIGIYLASYKAHHSTHMIDYQDINGKRDIGGDMLTIDLSMYDYVIATPPCNWWSRANYRRDKSEYAIRTKLLLPCILYKLALMDKPFIVENVLNSKFFEKYQLFSIPNVRSFKVGRHTYWTNINFDTRDLNKNERAGINHIDIEGKRIWLRIQNKSRADREGTQEVHEVIERFIQVVENKNYTFY